MAGVAKYFCALLVLFCALKLAESYSQQGTSISVTRSTSTRQSRQSPTQQPQQNRTNVFGRRLPHQQHHNHNNNNNNNQGQTQRSGNHNRTKHVRLEEKDKYYENGSDGDYEYEDYEYDDENTTTRTRDEEENKFIEGDTGIVLDHTDFVLLRLKHILMGTTDNITDILAKQKQEFKRNKSYREGWEVAVREYRKTKKEKIIKGSRSSSIVRKVPEEYHIALFAYTLGEPAMYSDFNRETREVCSGTDVENYQWKSFFKLLHLAIQTIGSKEEKYRDNRRFLYRGATLDYKLKEGQVIAFQHFISTSATLDVAEEFASKKTLFEFQGLYNGTAMNIQDFSFYEHEAETLFSPVQTFEVDSIHRGKHYTRYVLVKHEVPLPCDKTTPGYEDRDILEKIDVRDNSLKYSTGGVGSQIGFDKSLLIFTFAISFVVSSSLNRVQA